MKSLLILSLLSSLLVGVSVSAQMPYALVTGKFTPSGSNRLKVFNLDSGAQVMDVSVPTMTSCHVRDIGAGINMAYCIGNPDIEVYNLATRQHLATVPMTAQLFLVNENNTDVNFTGSQAAYYDQYGQQVHFQDIAPNAPAVTVPTPNLVSNGRYIVKYVDNDTVLIASFGSNPQFALVSASQQRVLQMSPIIGLIPGLGVQ